MANQRKRISELTALTSASLDTTIVGVDNGVTYKIELDTLADAVTSRVNILDRDRLVALEFVTASFETKNGTLATHTGSVNSQLSNLNSTTASLNSSVTNLNSTTASLNNFTASYFTDSSSFDSRITTEKERIDAILSASTADVDTFAEVVSLINSVDLTNDNAFATFYTASNARVSSLENATGSYETKGSGILSGSVSYLDLTNIPNGIVSQSTDITSLNTFTQSIDDRVDSLENATGSYLTSLNGAISSSSQLTSSFDERYTLSGSVQPLPDGVISGSTQISAFGFVSGSYETTGRGIVSGSSQITTLLPTGVVSGSAQTIANLPTGVISGSSQLTSSYDTRYAISASFVSSSNVASIQTITSASYAALTPVSGTLYIIRG